MIYYVHLEDCADYEVEADSAEEAQEQALEWWDERGPDVTIETDEEEG